MTNICDICREPVLPGQPRRGPPPGPGLERHWDCHTRVHGRPEPLASVVPAVSSGAPPRPRRYVRSPKVTRGADNRSPNAQRNWQSTGRVVSQMGKRRIEIECPFCFATFWAYVWSLAGGGKRCPNCRAMHTSFGVAYPLEGNEDLSGD